MISGVVAALLVAAVPITPGPAGARAEAEAAERQGDTAAADRAAERAVDEAGVAALVAAWLPAAGASAAAETAALTDAAVFAATLADRHGNDALLVHALTWSPGQIDRFRPALQRALTRKPYLASWLPAAEVDRIAAADPALPYQLASSLVSSRAPDRAGAKAAGLAGFRWLESELGKAQAAVDRDAIRRTAEALVAIDTDNVPALMALDLLQADPRRLARVGLDRSEVANAWVRDSRTMMLLGQSLAQDPGDTHLRLVLAWRQLQAGLAEDARREAGKVAASAAASREARRAGEVIENIAALDLGRGPAFLKWWAGRAGARSRFIEQWIINRYNDTGHLPDAVMEVRRQALRRVFVPAPPARDGQGINWWAWNALKDQKLDPATRQGALETVVAEQPELAPVARSCSAEKLPIDACARRIELASDLERGTVDDDDEPVTIDTTALSATLGSQLQVQPAWLDVVAVQSAEKLAGLGPWLDRLRARPIASSPAFARLDILIRWANKDAAGAARALDRAQALPRAQRLALRLVAGDVARGLVAPERAPALAITPATAADFTVAPTKTDRVPEWIETAYPGKDRLTALRRAQALLSTGYPAKAVADLRPLLGALAGEDRAEIAGFVFLAARAVHDAALEKRAAAEVETHAPASDVAAMIAAIRAAEGGGAAAEAAAGRWLRLAPTSPPAGRAFFAAIASRKDPRTVDAAARELLVRAGKSLHGQFARAAAAAGAKDADVACWRAVLAAAKREPATIMGKCPQAVAKAVGETDPLAASPYAAQKKVFDAHGAAAIARAAREAAVLFEIGREDRARNSSPAWLWFVAGEYEKSRAALKAAESAAGAGKGRADDDVDENEALRLLLAGPPIPDPGGRRAQFRRFTGAAPVEDDDDDAGDDFDDATRARKARNERERDVIWHLACLASGRGRRPQATLTACEQAWRRGRRTAATATALGGALFDNIEEARKQGLEVKAFLDQAKAALGGRLPGPLFAHEAAWLVTHGRLREAAAAAEQAWMAGAGRIGEGLDEPALGTAPFNPLLARYRAAVGGSKTHNALGITLASISAAEIEVAKGYVSQARAFYDKEADSAQERVLALFEELLILIDADVRDRALDPQGITRLVSRLFDSTRKDPFRDIGKDYPRSALAGVLVIEEAAAGPDPAAEVEHAKALLARFPRSALVAADAAFVFRKAGRMKEAIAAWNAGRAVQPDSPFLRGVIAPETQALPASLTSAEAHAKVLAAPVDVPSDAASLRLVDSDELGFSAVIPAAFKPNGADNGEGFAKDGVSLIFMRVPRTTYCEGLACIDMLVSGFAANGLKLRWRRIFTTPVGPGAEAFLQAEMGTLIAATIPVGGNLYVVMMGGPGERVGAELPALRMAFASFRPDDMVQPQPIAGKLQAGWRNPRTVLRARALLAKPAGSGCPIASLLDAADVGVAERRMLLQDAFMTTPWAATRLDLLKCEPAPAPGAPGVTLAALWDEAPSVRRIGVARVAAHPAAVLAEAKTLMRGDKPIEPPAGSTGTARDQRWVALLLALPPAERAELARTLLRQDQAHLRAIGLLAPRLADVEIGLEFLRVLRDGSARDARIAARALPDTLTRPMRDAIWARFDRAKGKLAKADRDTLFELAGHLVEHPDRGDPPRLARLRRLVAADSRGERARAEALRTARPEARAPTDSVPLLGLDRPLADVLPGRRWAFVRIAKPSLLLRRLSQLGHRLKAPTDAQQRFAQAFIGKIVSEIDLIRADSGSLDLDSAIECAALDGNIGRLLCAARTRADLPDDLDSTVRSLSLLQDVGGGALAIPIALPGLPFLLHESVYAKGDATQNGQESALLRERAQRTVTPAEAPGATAAWNIQVRFAPDGSGTISDEIVVRKNDRLFFSNSPDLARRFLFAGAAARPPTAAPAAPLGADPEFRAMAGRLVADADLTAIVMPGAADSDDKNPIALELSVTARGIATRLRLPYKRRAADRHLETLWRLLPQKPTLVFGAADISPVATATRPSPDSAAMVMSKADGAGLEPPTWLASATPAVLFGWYPREGGRLWDDWLAAVSWDDKVAALWRAHGMPAPPAAGAPAVKDGYRFKLVGRALIVSNAEVLVSEASHRGETEAVSDREEPVKATFDGEHVAASLEDRAGRAPTTDAGIALRSFAALSAVVKTATLGSVVSRDRSEVVIESLLTPTVEGTSGSALVEEWQQEGRFKNALRLPRALGESDANRPIRFVMEVEQDQQMKRAFPATARQKVEQVAPGRWRVSVTPGPALGDPVPASALSSADRHRFTDAAGIAPRIRSAAAEIIPDKTPPKEAARLILVWMKRNMTYELTPRELRDEAILERHRGDCSEYSKLTVALLRARGIPARLRSGFLADGSDLVAHAWVEFFDGTGWREIDPTNGEPSVDARHVDASLVDVMSLLSLAQIKVAGIE